ncbi:MAG: hypothetical protein KM310_10490 [Clostridiales bacterium]|nr:hypothetical protein [Clostridiales bacterium]
MDARKEIDRLIERAQREVAEGRYDEASTALQQAMDIAEESGIVHAGLDAAIQTIGEYAAMMRIAREASP